MAHSRNLAHASLETAVQRLLLGSVVDVETLMHNVWKAEREYWKIWLAGSAKRPRPGFVNAAGKLRKQEHLEK